MDARGEKLDENVRKRKTTSEDDSTTDNKVPKQSIFDLEYFLDRPAGFWQTVLLKITDNLDTESLLNMKNLNEKWKKFIDRFYPDLWTKRFIEFMRCGENNQKYMKAIYRQCWWDEDIGYNHFIFMVLTTQNNNLASSMKLDRYDKDFRIQFEAIARQFMERYLEVKSQLDNKWAQDPRLAEIREDSERYQRKRLREFERILNDFQPLLISVVDQRDSSVDDDEEDD